MEQLPEIILVDDVLHTLYTTPLLPWLREQDPPPVFDRRTPSCQRGYIGSWTIRDGVLWLTGVYAWRDGELTTLPDLFDSKREIMADWFRREEAGSVIILVPSDLLAKQWRSHHRQLIPAPVDYD